MNPVNLTLLAQRRRARLIEQDAGATLSPAARPVNVAALRARRAAPPPDTPPESPAPVNVRPRLVKPDPSEEELNTRAVANVEASYPPDSIPEISGSAVRDRVVDEPAFERARPAAPATKKQVIGQLLESVGRGVLAAQASDRDGRFDGADFARGVGLGLGDGLPGVIVPKLAAERAKQRRVAEAEARHAEKTKRRDGNLRRDHLSAQTVNLRAQAEWHRQRPDLEASKRRAAEARREQQAVLANLRLMRGQRLDASNPLHAALLRRAADAGVAVDADGWNSSASNAVLVELLDPSEPTRKRRALLNKATGEIEDVGQSGYVQPVNPASGMTAAQERADSDRDRSFAETLKMNDARLAQIGVQIERARRDLEGVSPSAAREFNVETKGLSERLNKKLAEAERWRKGLAEASVSPEFARERIAEIEAEVGEIQSRVEAARQRALGSKGRGSSEGGARRQSSGGRFAGRRMSRSKLPEAARRMGVSEAEAERIIRSEGGSVY